MRTQKTDSTNMKTTAMSVLACLFLCGNQVSAQGLEAGQMGSLSQSQALAPDHDSLLPPEVVPLDPAVATRMQMAQGTRTADVAVPSSQIAPGLSAQDFNGMHSARDFRQAALNSLMNHQGQWDGQFPQSAQVMAASQAGMPGQNQGTAAGQTQTGVVSHHASQTLTGAGKIPQVQRDTRRSGFSNKFSSGVALLSGFGMGGYGFPNSMFGLGRFGLGLTGFGSRNGFRF